jgi:hypothetical protein
MQGVPRPPLSCSSFGKSRKCSTASSRSLVKIIAIIANHVDGARQAQLNKTNIARELFYGSVEPRNVIRCLGIKQICNNLPIVPIQKGNGILCE